MAQAALDRLAEIAAAISRLTAERNELILELAPVCAERTIARAAGLSGPRINQMKHGIDRPAASQQPATEEDA